MKLTDKQRDYFNKEREKLIERIEMKRRYNINDNIIRDYARLEAIKLLSELHNLELKNDKDSE